MTSIGTPNHLAGLLFALQTKTEPLIVPYVGINTIIPDPVSGRVQVAVASLTVALPVLQSNRAKPLALTGTTRSTVAPDIPPASEAGVPGFDVASWILLVAPEDTPEPTLQRINDAVNKALANSEMQKALAPHDMETWPMMPKELIEYVDAEEVRWRDLMQEAGSKPMN